MRCGAVKRFRFRGRPAAGLIARLGEPAFVALTAMVAPENRRSRVNSAFGLTSQGFAEACRVPGGRWLRPERGARRHPWG